jgi:uncharacterized protein (DUF362 family)
MNTVSVSRIDEYDLDMIRSSLVRGFSKIGYVLPSKCKVLVKPNCMAQNRPDQHTVTHHTVVAALAGLLADNGCAIYIAESSAFFQTGLTRRAFDTTGMSAVAARYGARLLPLEEEKLERIDLSGYLGKGPEFPVQEIYIPRIVLDTDTSINACKLKSHGNGFRLSGAVKNLYGLLPGGFKQKLHLALKTDDDLCELIASLHKIAPPSVNVMDAIYGLDGGPAAVGKPVHVGAVLVSTNACALDVVAGRMIGSMRSRS